MKTKEELTALKEEVETVNRKLHELTEEELAQVAGGLLKPEGNAAIVLGIGGAAVIAAIAAVTVKKKKTAAGAEERQ